MEKYGRFPSDVCDKLGNYVYRLIDPRNGETFYVGKGKGNRVFAHAQAEHGYEWDELDDKLQRIRDIQLAGLEVSHIIHRHGMDEKTALEVEAALIDAYPGVTNAISGVGTSDFGVMHATEILQRYHAETASFLHKALLINVNRSATDVSLYEAVRYAWKIDPNRAEKADVILAIRKGIIVGTFIADEWLEATTENFPGRDGVPGRFGFKGRKASLEIYRLYVGKCIPDKYRQHGAANPVRYSW